MVQVQLLDPRGQPDGAPQAYRNPIGAKPDDLVVLRDDCILALATSARVLAHEETGRNARRA